MSRTWRWRRRLRFKLLLCNIRLDQNTIHVVRGHSHHLAAAQAAVSGRRLIVTFGEGERIPTPCQQCEPVADRLKQDRWLFEARQIKVANKIFDQLFDGNVITAPERYAVELHAQ